MKITTRIISKIIVIIVSIIIGCNYNSTESTCKIIPSDWSDLSDSNKVEWLKKERSICPTDYATSIKLHSDLVDLILESDISNKILDWYCTTTAYKSYEHFLMHRSILHNIDTRKYSRNELQKVKLMFNCMYKGNVRALKEIKKIDF